MRRVQMAILALQSVLTAEFKPSEVHPVPCPLSPVPCPRQLVPCHLLPSCRTSRENYSRILRRCDVASVHTPD